MQADEANMTGTLFVYGTLKRGEAHHARVASALRIEGARAAGRLYALVEGYPALVDADDGVVQGEVCYFDEIERVLPALDELEEVDESGGERRGLFSRERRRVTLASGEVIEAFIYLVRKDREEEILRAGARRLDSGVWKSERSRRAPLPSRAQERGKPATASDGREAPARSAAQAWSNRFLFALVGLAFLLVLRSVLGFDVDSASSPRPGVSAPAFRTSTPSGGSIELAGYRDHVVLVDFWATWCPPCVASMPTLERLYREYSGQGFIVLGVNQEAGDEALVRGFVESKGVTFPIAMDSGTIAHAYGVRSFPTSFLIGRDGLVRAMYRGAARESALRRDIEDALLGGREANPTGATR